MGWSGWPYRIYFATTFFLDAIPGFSKALTKDGCNRALRRIPTPSTPVLDVVKRAELRGKSRPGLEDKEKSVWFHAASLGEAYSVLPLVQRVLLNTDRAVHFSFNSASALAAIPDAVLSMNEGQGRVTCHFLPLDLPQHAEMFLNEVNPCLGVFVESELWPNLIYIAKKKKKVKLALVNARISNRSLRYWQANKALEALLLDIMRSFDVVYCKTKETQQTMEKLGLATLAEYHGDLKSIAASQLRSTTPSIQHLLGMIPPSSLVWIAGSTHEGEETVIVDVHKTIAGRVGAPVLTILAPRHPERARKVKDEVERAGLGVMMRSAAASTISSPILLLDTLGELRALYGKVDVAFVGASLPQSKQKGGHNTLEALNAGVRAVLQGPEVESNDGFPSEVILVRTSDEIADVVLQHITPLKTEEGSSRAEGDQVLTSIWHGLTSAYPAELSSRR